MLVVNHSALMQMCRGIKPLCEYLLKQRSQVKVRPSDVVRKCLSNLRSSSIKDNILATAPHRADGIHTRGSNKKFNALQDLAGWEFLA